MPDYSKTIIYKLINYDFPELIYVGSTTNFTKRKQQHKWATLNNKNEQHHRKVYETIRKNGGEFWLVSSTCGLKCRDSRHECSSNLYLELMRKYKG